MFCWTIPLLVILSLGFLSHLASSWLVGIELPILGWNFWGEYVFEAAREILGSLRAGALFLLVSGNLKFSGLMIISLERSSNTSDAGEAVWPADLRSEMVEGGIGWNRVPVPEVLRPEWQWSEEFCELGDCVRRTNRDSAWKILEARKVEGGMFYGCLKVQEAWAHWRPTSSHRSAACPS